MAATASNLVLGPSDVYRGAFGATEPADTAIASAPSALVWTDAGGTLDGVTINIAQEFTELMVDQVVDTAGRRLTKRDLSMKTNIAEPTLENLSFLANGGGSVTTGSGFKSFEPSNDTSATQPTYVALMFDAYGPGGRRRIIGRKLLSTEGIEFAYKKDAQTVFTATFSAHFVSTSITPFKIIDQV